jgi:hypothetical protein
VIAAQLYAFTTLTIGEHVSQRKAAVVRVGGPVHKDELEADAMPQGHACPNVNPIESTVNSRQSLLYTAQRFCIDRLSVCYISVARPCSTSKIVITRRRHHRQRELRIIPSPVVKNKVRAAAARRVSAAVCAQNNQQVSAK